MIKNEEHETERRTFARQDGGCKLEHVLGEERRSHEIREQSHEKLRWDTEKLTGRKVREKSRCKDQKSQKLPHKQKETGCFPALPRGKGVFTVLQLRKEQGQSVHE